MGNDYMNVENIPQIMRKDKTFKRFCSHVLHTQNQKLFCFQGQCDLSKTIINLENIIPIMRKNKSAYV